MSTTENTVLSLAPSQVKRHFNKWVRDYCEAHSTENPSPTAFGQRLMTVTDSEMLIDANLAIPDFIDALIDNYLRECISTARSNNGFDQPPSQP